MRGGWVGGKVLLKIWGTGGEDEDDGETRSASCMRNIIITDADSEQKRGRGKRREYRAKRKEGGKALGNDKWNHDVGGGKSRLEWEWGMR